MQPTNEKRKKIKFNSRITLPSLPFYFFVALAILLIDVILKLYIHVKIPPMHFSSPFYPFGGIAVFHNWHGIDFSIAHVMNKGAAWGIFASMQNYLLYARLLIVGGLFFYLAFSKTELFRKCCLALIATGAVGNVLDMFFYGHVIDMFYFIFWGYSFPVFNVADMAISCGIFLLLSETLILKCKDNVLKKIRGSA